MRVVAHHYVGNELILFCNRLISLYGLNLINSITIIDLRDNEVAISSISSCCIMIL